MRALYLMYFMPFHPSALLNFKTLFTFSGQFSSCPKKCELRIGEPSAFFMYVNSSKSNVPVDVDAPPESRIVNTVNACSGRVDNGTQNKQDSKALKNRSQGDVFLTSRSIRDSLPMERSPHHHPSPVQMEFPPQRNSKVEEFSQVHMHPRNESHSDVLGFHAHTTYPYYISGVMNKIMMSSSYMYPKNLQEPNRGTSAMLTRYNHIPQGPQVPGMTSFPSYPSSMCAQPSQIPITHLWPSYGSSLATEAKLGKVDRREAALTKFRQKRKQRCFEKKIRYVNRKRLAERRPRVRGQFVRRKNGINLDLNRQPDADSDEDEEEEEDNVG